MSLKKSPKLRTDIATSQTSREKMNKRLTCKIFRQLDGLVMQRRISKTVPEVSCARYTNLCSFAV